jgi:hypothetical protein
MAQLAHDHLLSQDWGSFCSSGWPQICGANPTFSSRVPGTDDHRREPPLLALHQRVFEVFDHIFPYKLRLLFVLLESRLSLHCFFFLKIYFIFMCLSFCLHVCMPHPARLWPWNPAKGGEGLKKSQTQGSWAQVGFCYCYSLNKEPQSAY